MYAHVKDVIEECTRASDEDRITFPDVVMRLVQAGVERYHADLVRGEKTYYLPDGESAMVPSTARHGQPSQDFSPVEVEAAIRAIQHGTIGYGEFCERILAAGCVGYLVSTQGRRAVYYGRTGEFYVEPFPQAA